MAQLMSGALDVSVRLVRNSPSQGKEWDHSLGTHLWVACAGGDAQDNRLDAFQKSDRWLRPVHKLDTKNWKSGIDEITGFEAFMTDLVSWFGLVSTEFAQEVRSCTDTGRRR